MNRQPVPPNVLVTLTCAARVVQGGSFASVEIDWGVTKQGLNPNAGDDLKKIDDGVGTFQLDGLVFDVYVDLANRQLWYDADKGWQ